MGTDAGQGSPGISHEPAQVNAESAVSGTRAMESPSEDELVGSPRNRDDGRDGSGQCHEFGSIRQSAIRETTDGAPMESPRVRRVDRDLSHRGLSPDATARGWDALVVEDRRDRLHGVTGNPQGMDAPDDHRLGFMDLHPGRPAGADKAVAERNRSNRPTLGDFLETSLACPLKDATPFVRGHSGKQSPEQVTREGSFGDAGERRPGPINPAEHVGAYRGSTPDSVEGPDDQGVGLPGFQSVKHGNQARTPWGPVPVGVGYSVGTRDALILFDTDKLPALGGGIGRDGLPLGVEAEPVRYLIRTGHADVADGAMDRP